MDGRKRPTSLRLTPKLCRTKKALAMDTLLVATQIICYGVGIVSASLNIASFVQRRVKCRRLHTIGEARR